jgi:hypothetical protein
MKPCKHPGCQHHVTHPCEVCGRVWGHPPLKCAGCGVVSDEVVVYRQNTRYVDEQQNYVAICPPCQEQNDEYWAGMWADYYSNCM